METSVSRVRKLLRDQGLSVAEFARRTGVPDNRIRKQFERDGGIKQPDLNLYAKALGTSSLYLLTGFEEPASSGFRDSKDQARFMAPKDLVLVPAFTVPRASAGFGESDIEGITDASHAISARMAKIAKGKIAAVEIRGDSMEPKLSDHDYAIVDFGDTEPTTGKTYIFKFGGEILVKDWASLGPHRGRLISTNANYPPIDIDQTTDLKCIGRVLGKETLL